MRPWPHPAQSSLALPQTLHTSPQAGEGRGVGGWWRVGEAMGSLMTSIFLAWVWLSWEDQLLPTGHCFQAVPGRR